MVCLPDSLEGRQFYHPTNQGQEGRYRERLEQIRAWKDEQRKKIKKEQGHGADGIL